jgi:hypothetical protein
VRAVLAFSCRSALSDVEAGLQPDRLGIDLEVEGANTRLLWVAYRLADGGRIAACKGWSVARWYATVGFRPRHILPQLEAAGLIRWEGDDLVVLEYIRNHEERIRGLRFVQVPAMMAARGFDPTHYGGVAPPLKSKLGVGSQRVNCAKVLKTPTTEQSTDQSTDSGSETDPDPPLRSDSFSGPPVLPRGSQTRQPPGRSSGPARPPGSLASRLEHRDPVLVALPTDGPEGFERWVRAMPVPMERQPRAARVWLVWRERMLEHWCRYDLEGETDEILAHVERLKLIEQPGRYVPSGINFLRAAEWRGWRPKAQPSVEVFEPAPTWRPPESSREELNQYVKSLVRS